MKMPKEKHMMPSFHLESVDGKSIGPSDYKEKLNLLIYVFDINCGPCLDFLKEASGRYDDYKELNAEILAIAEGSTDVIKDVAQKLNLQFPVLIDADGSILKQYSLTAPAVFVADKFGEIELMAAKEGEHLPDHDEILNTIELAEIECPECGVSTWPTD